MFDSGRHTDKYVDLELPKAVGVGEYNSLWTGTTPMKRERTVEGTERATKRRMGCTSSGW